MRVRDIKEMLGLELVAGSSGLDRMVQGGYCGDLLSDVMANAPQGGVWLTVQAHQNIVAVAARQQAHGGAPSVAGRMVFRRQHPIGLLKPQIRRGAFLPFSAMGTRKSPRAPLR